MARVFRLLLLAFPPHLRARIGRPLLQTMLTDCRVDGRIAPRRLPGAAWDLVRAGLAARVEARRMTREPGRGWRGLADDLHHVRRSLARRRAYAATVIATLTVGVAVSATVFAIITTVFIRDLPYRDPSRLAFMWSRLAWVGVPRAWVAGPHIDRLTREARTIEAIVPIRTSRSAPMVVNGRPQAVVASFSHAGLFDVLGVRPALGRGFVEADEPRNVAVLSHQTWVRSFARNPDVVGMTFEYGPDRLEVIGVMPDDFRFVVHSSLGEPSTVDIWLPTRWPLATMSDGAFGFAALVRVKPEATLAAAQAELDVIGRDIDLKRFKSQGFGWDLTGVRDDLTRSAWAPMRLLGIAASLLLLVVAANMAGLMLTRQGDRQREFAVRTALGAGRGSLARLILIESVGLWVIAAALGLALSAAVLPLVASSTTLPLPRIHEVRLDPAVIGATMGFAVLGGLIFGLIPALRTTRGVVGRAMNEVGRGNTARATWARSVLVVAEVSIAVALVAGGTLLIRSYTSLQRADPGFSPSGVLLAYLSLDVSRYPQERQAVDRFSGILARLQALPGVVAAGGTTSRPLEGVTDQAQTVPEGWVPTGTEDAVMTDLIRVTPGYVGAMGITVIEGRDFAWTDRADGLPVVMVDERYARAVWPGGRALGRQITIRGNTPIAATVVGVVRHARQYRYDTDDRPQILRPYAQDTTEFLTLAIRTTGDPAVLVQPLRDIVAQADPRLPVARVTTMRDVVNLALLDRILQLSLVAVFAVCAIVLAALGVYSVLAALVRERGREIGIRMALGADAAAVRAFVLRRLALLTGAGLALGLLASLAASRLVEPLLFGITARDPGSLLLTGALMLVTAMLAAWLPLRRATRIDPAVALRSE